MISKLIPIIPKKITADEDPRVTAYRQYTKERADAHDQEWKLKETKSKIKETEARTRLVEIDRRLKAIGLKDLFSTGVHSVLWTPDEGQVWEIWITLTHGRGNHSEQVVNRLLTRFEHIISDKKAVH